MTLSSPESAQVNIFRHAATQQLIAPERGTACFSTNSIRRCLNGIRPRPVNSIVIPLVDSLEEVMSICVDYFFNHQSELLVLGQELNAWLGSSLAAQEADPEELFCRFLGMELSLSEHPFENDRELNFEDFRYRVGIRSPIPEADLRTMQIPVMAFIAYSLFRRMGIVGMLVYDGQSLLARYEASVEDGLDELFDLVSHKIVRFPDHLESLSCHLPDYAS